MKTKEFVLPDMKDDNIIEFKPKTDKLIVPATAIGGTGDNWLMGLDIGTVFLTRQKKNYGAFELMEFHLFDKTDKNVKLFASINRALVWVDSNRFSSTMEFVEKLGWYDIQSIAKKEEENGTGD